MDTGDLIGEPLLQYGRSADERWASELLGIDDGQEDVKVADDDAEQLHESATGDDHVEDEKDPRKVQGLEAGAEPEGDDGVLVHAAPDVQDGEDHCFEEDLKRLRRSVSVEELRNGERNVLLTGTSKMSPKITLAKQLNINIKQ